MDAGVSTNDLLCACSSGQLKEQLCLDLNRIEENFDGAFLPVAIKASSQDIVYFQLSCRLAEDKLEDSLRHAIKGCNLVRKYLEGAIHEHMSAITNSLNNT
jgi:ribonuclease PH